MTHCALKVCFIALMVSLIVQQAFGLPDLKVESITPSPDPPVLGHQTTITASIKNVGNQAVNRGYQGRFDIDGYPYGSPIQFPPGLAPGQTTTAQTTWTPQQGGPYAIGFSVDITQNVTETDESGTSNYRQISVSPQTAKPDMIVQDIVWEPAQPYRGSSVTIKATIKNIGYIPVPIPCWGGVSIDGISAGLAYVPGPIPVGGLVEATFVWTPAESRTYQITFHADAMYYVSEMDEQNNGRTEEVAVSEPPQGPPDLAIDGVEWKPQYPVNGSLVTMNFTVRNRGNATARAPFKGLLSGPLGVIGSTTFTSDLAPNAIAIAILTWEPNLTGLRTFHFDIDSDAAVTEWNETNNRRSFQVLILASNLLPDLVVTDIWHKGSTVHYQIMNRGNGTAHAGSKTQLYIDESAVKSDTLGVDLAPGERRYGQFSQCFGCQAKTATVRVCADASGLVPESDETNNCRTEVWKCDEEPPEITKAPSVAAQATSAIITWQTNEPSNSVLTFDQSKPIQSRTVRDASLGTDHKLVLKDLNPSTGYAFYVESSDASGNSVRSATYIFFTAPLKDSKLPTIGIQEKVGPEGTSVLQANVSDDVGVSRVEFYIDGRHQASDYSYPYELPLDGTAIEQGEHTVLAVAYDLLGNFAEIGAAYTVERPEHEGGPLIVILNPRDGDTLSGKIDVRVLATDPDGIDTLEIYLDAERIYSRSGVPDLSLGHGGSWASGPDKSKGTSTSFNITLPVDTLDWDNGPHTLRVKGWDIHDNVTEWTLHVTIFNAVPRRHPHLVLSRPEAELRERPGEGSAPGIVVALQIRNAGNAVARDITIEDILHGFCPTGIYYTAPTSDAGLSVQFYRSASIASALITIPRLDANRSLTIKYAVIPVLRETAAFYGSIGATVMISYNGTQGDHYGETICLTSSDVSVEMESPPFHWSTGDVVSLSDAVSASLYCSDYLIVTCPANMISLPGTDEEMGLLLRSMARLAWLRKGALAFLNPHAASTMRSNLCDLIWEGGDWSEQLDPDYSSRGYLLIVGESDIVPSWHHGDFDITWSDDDTRKDVDYCDTDYGDSNGNWLPEIIVGRIIGESANVLRSAIDASIAVAEGGWESAWESLSALLISGYGDHYGQFEDNIDDCYMYLWLRCGGIEKLAMHDFFELDRFDHDFTRYDGLAVGDVTGGTQGEIVIAKDDNHRLYVYSGSGSLLMDEPWTDFDADCIMRALERSGQDWLAILDPGAGRIRSRSADGINTGSRSITTISGYCDFATGDVNGDGDDEYVVASDDDNRIYIYGTDSTSFAFVFTDYDRIAVGDVVGDSKEEIIIAKDDDNAIYIYDRAGSLLGTITSSDRTYYTRYDRLAVGDMCDDGKDEIVIAMDDDGYVRAYNATGHERGSVDLGFTRYDQLAVGDVLGDAKEEIVIARDDDHKVIVADMAWTTRIRQEIQTLSCRADLIMFNGHGNVDNWNCFRTADVPSGFCTATPIVYAVTCLSGNYEDGGIAERFLETGAAVYIGSTMVSPTTVNSWAGKRLLSNWVDTPRTIGQAFKQTERDVTDHFGGVTHGEFGKFWVAEYNLYGDPKFGKVPEVGSLTSLSAPENPQTEIEVQIPQLEISMQDGHHIISLPGGGFTMEQGMPQLPTFVFTQTVPSGWKVNDVALVEKRGESISEGIGLPPLQVVNGSAGLAFGSGEEGYPEGIYPSGLYNWNVVEGDLGQQTLVIYICPVTYNMLTAQLVFWQEFSFQVNYSRSVATIAEAQTDTRVYGLGDEAKIEVSIDLNEGKEIEAVLYGSVRSSESAQPFDGTKLEKLVIRGRTYASLTWEVSGVQAGGYVLDLFLADAQGNLLDSRAVRFWVGVPGTSMVSVSANPEFVAPDGSVTATVSLLNDGDVQARGDGVVWIMDGLGRTVAQSELNLTAIPPHSTTSLEHTFDLSRLADGEYWIGVWAMVDGAPAGSEYARFMVPEFLPIAVCLAAIVLANRKH